MKQTPLFSRVWCWFCGFVEPLDVEEELNGVLCGIVVFLCHAFAGKYKWLGKLSIDGSHIHLLNTTTRMLFEIWFVMLIGIIVFPFALGIQCLHENEKLQSILVVVFS